MKRPPCVEVNLLSPTGVYLCLLLLECWVLICCLLFVSSQVSVWSPVIIYEFSKNVMLLVYLSPFYCYWFISSSMFLLNFYTFFSLCDSFSSLFKFFIGLSWKSLFIMSVFKSIFSFLHDLTSTLSTSLRFLSKFFNFTPCLYNFYPFSSIFYVPL